MSTATWLNQSSHDVSREIDATPLPAGHAWVIVAWALLVSSVIGLRFSPDWVRFLSEAREAEASATHPTQRRAIERALISGAAERGALVIDQQNDLGVEITDPVHKAIRWRLLPPALGQILQLPAWATLGLAHVGCIALVLMLVALGQPESHPLGFGGVWLGLTAGATAPVITSLGWLGYYDSLLALGLLAVAFVRNRGAVIVACLLTPWIDERFVLALPLALGVRWHAHPAQATKVWLRREAAVPALLTIAFALTRLSLGGTGGSHTAGDYIRTFIWGQEFTLVDRVFGAWSGLRIGWFILAAGFAAAWFKAPNSQYGRRASLGLGLLGLVTALIGLISAQDTARSMGLILPLVPWAWKTAANRWPGAWRWAGPTLALAALLTPAYQVFGQIRIPVPPDRNRPADQPIVRAENNLGYLHDRGEGGIRNPSEAAKWYRRAAAAGLAEAQFNLAMLLLLDPAAEADRSEGEHWLVSAGRQGLIPAQRTLAFLYLGNHGFTKHLPRAWAWLSLSDPAAVEAADLFATLSPEAQAEAKQLRQSLIGSGP